MPNTQDDLTSQLVPTDRGGALRFGQGTILGWNPDTFENEIEWRGTTLSNLPVLSGADALTFREGDQVGLLGSDPGGKQGASSWSILGRLVVPGTGRGTEAVGFLSTQLASAISAAVFADRIKSATNAELGNRSSAGFGDLNGSNPSDPGPDVIVDISDTGTAIVFLTSWIETALGASSGTQTGIVGVEVLTSPGNQVEVSPEILNSKYLRFRADTEPWDVTDRSTAVIEISGLDPGRYRFKMVYSRADSGVPNDVFFAERNITVIGL